MYTYVLFIGRHREAGELKMCCKYDMNNPIECLDLHLKEITLNYYRGTGPEVKFAKFFVLNASANEARCR